MSDRDLFRAAMGREPESDEELAEAVSRWGSFTSALQRDDPAAKAVLTDFVRGFTEAPCPSPVVLRTQQPKRRRTVVL